jgi:DNA-binding CsgD family transcriptional regulator
VSLDDRIHALAAQLSTLSEASAALAPDAVRVSGGDPDRFPPGFRDGQPTGACPSPDDDLYGWFEWRVRKAGDDESELLAVVTEGEIRYGKRTHRAPVDMQAGAVGVGATVDPVERDKRIAQGYPGLSPAEVRVIETARAGYVSEANIRRVRILAGHDPEDGARFERVRWQSISERQQLAAQLKDDRMTVAEIARALNVSEKTVSNDLARTRVAA